MKTVLYKSNPWWEERYSFEGFQRERILNELKQWLDNRDIVFLTGLRRVGKTSLMKNLISCLIHEYDIEPKHIFYVTLDLYALDDYTISEILTEYRKIHKLPSSQKVYLFLDEITSKEAYHRELKNLYDLENVKIYASSSSASLLKDKQAYLTGRQRLIEVMPLDFDEYLLFKGIQIKPSDAHLLESYFENYMQDGGMPEYVLTSDVSYLQNLIDNIISKDIIAHYNIRQTQSVKDFFKLLMERSGKQLSFNKMATILDISVDTAKRYYYYFEECYLIYGIERYAKLNERLRSPKKIYACDVGIRNVVTGYRDKGAIYENLLFLKLKPHHPKYLYVDGIELDFITEEQILLEAKYHASLNEKQQKLYDSFPAVKKYVLNGFEGYEMLDTVLSA